MNDGARTILVIARSMTRYEILNDGILAAVTRNHRTGESDFETAQRMLIHERLAMTGGRQKEAAVLLGVSSRVLNYHCKGLQLRPKDQ